MEFQDHPGPSDPPRWSAQPPAEAESLHWPAPTTTPQPAATSAGQPVNPRAVINSTRYLGAVLLGLTLLLVARYALPLLAEELQYAITRGRQRAEYELAGQQLTNVSLQHISDAYQLIMQRIGPSVVHIDTARQLGQIAEEGDRFHQQIPFQQRGQGSGVIIDADGYILTNLHVVDGADQVLVTLADNREVAARIVGTDPLTDLALLQVDQEGLIPAEWGDSDSLREGALVWAVGSPFGLSRSITAGILSARNRGQVAGNQFQDFLQTDVAVNPGNSGGPLVDSRGRVVGINTAIFGLQYRGVSFAIPSAVAQDVYKQLRQQGSVAHGYLGVELDSVSAELAAQLGQDQPTGAVVRRLRSDGPARDAGLRQGDVIMSWNDQPVTSPADLVRLVPRTRTGSRATVVLVREGATHTLEVTVGQRPQ